MLCCSIINKGFREYIVKIRNFRFSFLVLSLFCSLLAIPVYSQQDPFGTRREKVLQKLNQDLLLLVAQPDNDENRHEYRPNSNFWYLTGFPESPAVALFDPSTPEKYFLFIPEQHVISAIYNGKQPDHESLKKLYKAGAILSLRELPGILKKAENANRTVFTDLENQAGMDWLQKLVKQENKKNEYKDFSDFLAEMRIVKDEYETELLQKTCDITAKALSEAYKFCQPGMNEYEIEAIIEYNYRKSGSPMPGFRSIVASGPNATTLHYVKNNRIMENGELLLMDVGAEYGMYSADITRTIPVNGKFSKEQKEIYSLVLKAQEEAIKLMVPGKGNLEAHHKAVDVLSQGLFQLGLMTDKNSLWQKRLYIIYRVNHWLGLDVHDVGSYGPTTMDYRKYMWDTSEKGRTLVPGMVSTIEPGIYLRADLLDNLRLYVGDKVPEGELESFLQKVKPVFEKYKNIGIRIEDDILITKTGNTILSGGIPKSIEEIEKMMQ